MLVHGTVYLQVFHYLTFILGEEEREGQEPEEEQEGELWRGGGGAAGSQGKEYRGCWKKAIQVGIMYRYR